MHMTGTFWTHSMCVTDHAGCFGEFVIRIVQQGQPTEETVGCI